MQLNLTVQQEAALTDVLDAWLDEYEEATTEVERDRSFETVEDYLGAVQGMHESFDLISGIRSQLPVGVPGGN